MNYDNYIGIVFSYITEEQLLKLLSQMSKSQLETSKEYFYIFSNNEVLKKDITNKYFKDAAFSNYSKEKELNLLNSIDYFICSEEYSNSEEMEGKKVVVPSEDSFYFTFDKNQFPKFI